MPLTQRRSLRTTIYETEPRVQPYREYNWNRDLRNSSPSADQRTSQRRYQPNAEDHLPVRCQLSSGIYPIEDYSNTLPTSYRSGAKNAAHENNAEDTAIGATHAERLLLASRSRLATQRAINNEVAEYEAHSHSEAVRQRHQRRLLQMQQAQQKEISTLSKDRPSVSVSGSYFRGGTTRPNAVDASIEELGEQLSVEPSFESATKDSAVHSMVESAPQKDTSASSDPHTSSKVAELLREGLARIEQQTLLQESDVKSIASEAESILAKSPRLRERLTHIKTPEHASSDHQPCERSDEVKGHHPGREGDCVVELHNEKSPNELETIDPGPGMGATRDFRELLRTQKIRIVETDVVFTSDNQGKNGEPSNSTDDAIAHNPTLQELTVRPHDGSEDQTARPVNGGFTLKIKAASSSFPSQQNASASDSFERAKKERDDQQSKSSQVEEAQTKTDEILYAAASAARVAAQAAAAAAYVSIGTGGFTKEAYKKVLDLLALP